MTRVLLADDDVEMRQLLAASLSHFGYDVQVAVDGDELLEALHAGGGEAPDVVVSDVHVPGFSHLQLLPWVKSWRPSLPVVLITAFADVETRALARELGAAAVLHKPFGLDALRDTNDRLTTSVEEGAPFA